MKETRLIAASILSVIGILVLVPNSVVTIVRGSETCVTVGAYYYVWYGDYDFSSGEGRHWNTTSVLSDTVIDLPALGYYSSQNESVIRQHLDWMKYAGLDFLIISWWGPNSYEDNSTKIVFHVTQTYAPWMRLAIMVEGFNDSLGPEAYNFTSIYEYIYHTYQQPYNSIYLRLYDKPVVYWFNFPNMTDPPANREKIYSPYIDVEPRIVGQSAYDDWWFGIPYWGDPSATVNAFRDGMVCVEPRWDNTHLAWGSHGVKFDETYSERLYDSEWNQVVNMTGQGKVKIVTIYSWNEFHERSQIEPCIDKTSYMAGNAKFILDKTKNYVAQIRSSGESSPPFQLLYGVVGLSTGLVVGTLVTALIYTRKRIPK